MDPAITKIIKEDILGPLESAIEAAEEFIEVNPENAEVVDNDWKKIVDYISATIELVKVQF